MSKINAVRLINVNYNNNAIRISDECFHFNGESTLISLRNGGGKSVLVQMMTAPFVHRRYRDAKDRPFAGYFTTARPSFILVEWVLDQGAGYVLTGMMVRRNQEIRENGMDELDMINLVSEYRKPCLQDIHHLPVVEKGKKEITLKSFSACRQLFESWKRERSLDFFYYDMNNTAQSRQYFDKLKEYQIDYREWETIIKKINLKESGLSDLFSDCRDEKGLVEKWFLEAVEGKLNREKNRVREFQSIVEKYTGQYKDNRSKIRRRDVILRFKEETVPVRDQAEKYRAEEEKRSDQENRIACFIRELEDMHQERQEQYGRVTEQIARVRASILRTEYERISAEIHDLEKQKTNHVCNRDMIGMEQENLEREKSRIQRKLHIFRCARQQVYVNEQRHDLEVVRERLNIFRKRDEDLEPERNLLGGKLKNYYNRALEENRKTTAEMERQEREARQKETEEQDKLAALSEELLDLAAKSGMLRAQAAAFDAQEEIFNRRYKTDLTRNILGSYEPGMLEIRRDTWQKELEEVNRERLSLKKR